MDEGTGLKTFANDEELATLLLEYYRMKRSRRQITIIEIRRRHSFDFDYLMPLLRANPPRSMGIIARMLSVTPETIARHIKILREIGAIPNDMYRHSNFASSATEA
ncbi:MAG: HTH domain-containing protein [Nitrososphaera sp.]